MSDFHFDPEAEMERERVWFPSARYVNAWAHVSETAEFYVLIFEVDYKCAGDAWTETRFATISPSGSTHLRAGGVISSRDLA